MKNFFLVILYATVLQAFCPAGNAFAQSKKPDGHLPQPPAYFFHATEFAPGSLNSEEDITCFILQNFPAELFGDLRQTALVTSPIGKHYTFRQHYAGLPVYKTELKLNLDRAGNILSVNSALYPLPAQKSTRYSKSATAAAYAYLEDLLGEDLPIAKYTTQKELYVRDNSLLPGVVLTYGSPNTSIGSKEILLSPKGVVIDQYDLISNYKKGGHDCLAHASAPARPKTAVVRDTAVSALVYRQAPAPSGSINYLKSMITQPDEFQELLSAQREAVDLMIGFRNDTFLLQTPYCIIKEFDPPAMPVKYSLTPAIDLHLGDGFEQINILYHISAWQKYIQSLGLNNLANTQIEVDANGWNGRDQSSYSSFTNTLSFGTGGVKDGQDPQVIIHEYSHAIARSATAGAAVGYERRVLEEANADYFAVSYKKTTDSTDWQKIFVWDGHNEFWPGRMAITDKTYPKGMQGDMYKDAAIWTAALMQIHNKIGSQTTDKLLLHSLYSYSSYTDLPTAAALFLQADELLNNGKYSDIITETFRKRGLMPPAQMVATK